MWLLNCDIFRTFVISDLQILTRFVCRNPHTFGILRANKNEEKIKELYELYNSQNSFLYSSLNMELVYAILRGINVCLREINGVATEATGLSPSQHRLKQH